MDQEKEDNETGSSIMHSAYWVAIWLASHSSTRLVHDESGCSF
jgi:hypothetical protein